MNAVPIGRYNSRYIFFQELSLFKDKQTKNSNDNDIFSN